MIRERLSVYRARVRRELTSAFEEAHTPREVAASFAIGIFVTAMPTGGLGIGLFFVLVYLSDRINKTAIFASVVVLNPFVKPVVYLSSVQLGAILVGTEPVAVFGNSTLDYVATVIKLLLLGNVLIAAGLAAVSYVLVYRWTSAYRQRDGAGEEISPYAVLISLSERWRR